MSNQETFKNRKETGTPEQFTIYAKSVASENHPNVNKDAVLIDSEHGIFGVFDGVGGLRRAIRPPVKRSVILKK